MRTLHANSEDNRAVPSNFASRKAGEMKIVDPHMHLWNLERISYPWLANPRREWFMGPYDELATTYDLADFLSEADDSDIEIVKIVHVEAGADPTDRLKESAWLQAIADEPNSAGRPNGIVAAVDLAEPDLEQTLQAHRAFAALRGVRQILNCHPNPFYDFVGQQFMSRPDWKAGFSLLSRYNLSFDMQIYPSQMLDAAALAKSYPDTLLVLNHTGMHIDRNTLEGWRAWRDGMRALATNPNIMVKISGMGMIDHHWTIESIRPYILETIDSFGVNRCMFASNFPVDRLFGSYGALWHAFYSCVSGFQEPERELLFRRNAERIYRI
jgi:predicted TIM-barrel fold metal-dependent hydrolase